MMSLPVWLPGLMSHVSSSGVSVSGPMFLLGEGLCLWSHVPSRESLSAGVSLTETPLDRDPLDRDSPEQRPPPLYGKERAVRILLECILVLVKQIVIGMYAHSYRNTYSGEQRKTMPLS